MMNVKEIEADEAVRRMEPVSAPDAEQEAVTEFSAFLDRVAKSPTNHLPKCVLAGPLGEKMELPASIFYVLERVAEVEPRLSVGRVHGDREVVEVERFGDGALFVEDVGEGERQLCAGEAELAGALVTTGGPSGLAAPGVNVSE